MKKKINMKEKLIRYDISQNGKVTEDDFINAVNDLHLGFIEDELRQLAQIAKPKVGKEIIIDEFLEMMKFQDPNYRLFIDEQSDKNNEITEDNKLVSRKYDRFEKKPFNVDY